MKCSLKDGFINILFIILIAPSEGVEFPLLLQANSVIGEPINFQQFRATLNRLQDSFPNDDDSENNIHKIVKKQMAVSDSGEFKKKRSVFNLPEEGDAVDIKGFGKSKRKLNDFEVLKNSRNTHQSDSEFSEDFKKDVKTFSRHKRSIFKCKDKDKEKEKEKEKERAKEKEKEKEKEMNTEIDLERENEIEKEMEMQKERDKQKQAPPLNCNKKGPSNHNCTKAKTPHKEDNNTQHTNPKEPNHDECNDTCKDLNMSSCDPNPNFKKYFMKVADPADHRCYYEFETNNFGCIKLKHKRCPNGEFFSSKTSKCIKIDIGKCRSKRHVNFSKFKRVILNPNPPEEPDPSNEWLDATQGSRIPPEFKPLKKPELKIFHLILRKKLNGMTIKKRNALGGSHTDNRRNKEIDRGTVKRQEPKTRRAKSFVIHIHKKAGKDESVAESEGDVDESEEKDENEEKDEEEENEDEEGEEDEAEEEEEEADDEASESEITQKSPLTSKESIKEFFKTAKEAVTNRARFEEGPMEPKVFQKNSSFKSKKSDLNGSYKSKKSEESEDVENKKKKVLIDANIKVDSAISNALKCVLKGGMKENIEIKNTDNNVPIEDEALISDRGSQDQMDPELIRMYEHLLRHNPRVKRYFQRHKKELERPQKNDLMKVRRAKSASFGVREAKPLERNKKFYFFPQFQRS